MAELENLSVDSFFALAAWGFRHGGENTLRSNVCISVFGVLLLIDGPFHGGIAAKPMIIAAEMRIAR